MAAIDRYVRARARRPDANSEWLWLGRRGQLRETGLKELLRLRGRQAGLDGLHPHAFRHAYAHHMLAAGMQEGDLMAIAGWRQPADAPPLRGQHPTGAGHRRRAEPVPWRPAGRAEAVSATDSFIPWVGKTLQKLIAEGYELDELANELIARTAPMRWNPPDRRRLEEAAREQWLAVGKPLPGAHQPPLPPMKAPEPSSSGLNERVLRRQVDVLRRQNLGRAPTQGEYYAAFHLSPATVRRAMRKLKMGRWPPPPPDD